MIDVNLLDGILSFVGIFIAIITVIVVKSKKTTNKNAIAFVGIFLISLIIFVKLLIIFGVLE